MRIGGDSRRKTDDSLHPAEFKQSLVLLAHASVSIASHVPQVDLHSPKTCEPLPSWKTSLNAHDHGDPIAICVLPNVIKDSLALVRVGARVRLDPNVRDRVPWCALTVLELNRIELHVLGSCQVYAVLRKTSYRSSSRCAFGLSPALLGT